MMSPMLERLAEVRRDELLTLAGEHHENQPADRRAASSRLSAVANGLRSRLSGCRAGVRPHRRHLPSPGYGPGTSLG